MTRKILILSAALALSLSAVAQQQFIADKVVAVVGGQPVLYSDVAEQARMITEEYRAQNYTSPREPMAEALEMLLEQKLLYQRAQIDSIGLDQMAPEIALMVDSRVEEMLSAAGSIKALEDEMHKPLYTIKDEMRAEIEEFYGAGQMRQHINGQVKVIPGEVDRFYRRMDSDSLPIIPEQYVYAQITRLPRSIEIAKQRTRENLLELRQRIIDGERFDQLARLYSLDGGSALRGGEYDPAPIESWVEPFADAVGKLQPGQVSGIVETEFGFHIIQLMDKPSDNLYHVRHILLKPTYTTQEQVETIDFLDSLAGAIRGGGITFEEAAMRYSDDKATRMNGGVVSNQQMHYRMTGDSSPRSTDTRFIRDALDPADAVQLIRLGEGEISRAFMGRDLRMDEMGKILKLVQIIPAHKANLSEDWLEIEQLALGRKQQAHYKEWLDGRIDEMYVRIDPMFSPGDLVNKRWFK
ncbi:MAG: peptidylprolyl isomerase [Alistipes sp.]|jgi:peptidyl-prolyl cis-trans isomerase SurA|nr:peptidylprolyl isomerase [Alistipes sp.]